MLFEQCQPLTVATTPVSTVESAWRHLPDIRATATWRHGLEAGV